MVASSTGTCTIPDTELVGGDLASSVGGGGLKLGRGAGLEDCLARSGRLTRLVEGPGRWLDTRLCRCRENPGCLWYTWDSRDELCHLKSGRGYQRSRSPALYRTHPGAPCRPLVTPIWTWYDEGRQ